MLDAYIRLAEDLMAAEAQVNHPPIAGTDDEKWQCVIDRLARQYPDCAPALRMATALKQQLDGGDIQQPIYPRDLRSDETIFAEVDAVASAVTYKTAEARKILAAARARVAALRAQAANRERQLVAAERAFVQGWPDALHLDHDAVD